jgi:hypothetical protein
MMQPAQFKKGKAYTLAVTVLLTGSLWASSCSLRSIRDSAWSGAMSAVEGASAEAISHLIESIWGDVHP